MGISFRVMENKKSHANDDVVVVDKAVKIPNSLIPQSTKYGEKPDITFIFPANGGATISAEKIALSSKSDVFQKQFIASKDSPEERIQITDISFDIFNKFIKYIYGHEIDIYEENYLEILYAAQKYFVNQLTFLAIEFIKKFINENNVDEHFEFIEKFDIKMLNEHMKKVIITKPLEIIKKLTTSAPHKRILQIILEMDTLPCTEFQLYTEIRALLIKSGQNSIQNGKTLRNELGNLIYLIRFPAMSITDLIKCGQRPSLLKNRELVDFLLWIQEKTFSDTLQFYSNLPRIIR